ncbi:MAG: nuclear transport factor 2 family protein [Chloroflexi bacterium]|nr:MAG: nuclear transport factor 2 family protein [Chloroflexota bacterium]
MEPTPGKTFYQRQIAALEAHDMDALLAQYHPDATMIGFDFTVKGHAAIRKHFEGYLERLGTLKLQSTDKFTETEDAIFFEATITSRLGEARVYDVLLLQNGKTTHHFSGVISLRAN